MDQRNFRGRNTSLSLKTARPAELKLAINDALKNLPDAAAENEVVAWLREHCPWIWERSHLELLAERALAERIGQVLDSMCASATEADPDVIAYQDRPGRLRYVLRSCATEEEKLASRRWAREGRMQC